MSLAFLSWLLHCNLEAQEDSRRWENPGAWGLGDVFAKSSLVGKNEAMRSQSRKMRK
jgi:hypothetical protein